MRNMRTRAIKIRKWVKIASFLIILISSFLLYSRFLGIKGLKVKEYSIIDSNIPANFYGLKIIQISDIHYKVTTQEKDLKNMVKQINLLKPDIVIFSGDLFDKNIKYTSEDINDLKNIFNSIDYNIGKYSIKGEQDLNNDNYEKIMNDSNFINLNDNYTLVYNNDIDPILLVGISSNYKSKHIKETLNKINSEIKDTYKYSILILHEPDLINDIKTNSFNLILAGHSHNGYITIPFIGGIIKNKYSKNYVNPYYKLNKTNLYISGGVGNNSNFKFRLLNKPSINLYRLRNK